jgi:hypothetical protein
MPAVKFRINIVVLAALVFVPLPALATPYGINLLVNGDAEAGPASSNGTPIAVPGWTTVNGFTVIPYGAAGGFPNSNQGPPDGLNQFFAGGNALVSTATQDIEVSAIATDIDAADVVADISGWFGGFGNQNDYAQLKVSCYGTGGTQLSTVSIGHVTAADRNNTTGLLFRRTRIVVPPQTRTIHAHLLMTRLDTGTFNDGYADSLSIVLTSFRDTRGSNLVHDGGFELSSLSGFAPWWQLNEPNGFSNVGTNPTYAHSGTKHANLTPDVGATGSLSQALVTTPGTKYTLTFWLTYFVADANTFFDAYVDNSLVFGTVVLPPAGVYQQYTATFTAQGASTVLRFDYRNDTDFWYLDDVAVLPLTATLANISTRLLVQTGDNALIGGFIITGTQPKKIIIRALGPSVPLLGNLADPTLELYQGNTLLETNDNWEDSPNRQAIIDSTIPPSNPLESAIVRTVTPGAYTAVVRGAGNGTGIGVVEAYDLDAGATSKLVNISTRGLVQTGDNVLIAGTIVVGPAAQKVIIRALGPSVPVPGAMADPTLELHDNNGAVLESNDDWIDSPNQQAIIDSTIPPTNDLESAILRTLMPGNYTAIVRGANNTTGIAVVEMYALP